jgi:hypothetical protein
VPGCSKQWAADPVLAVACPTCPAKPGQACRSPSGHSPWHASGRFHPARDLAADAAGAYGKCPLGRCGQSPEAKAERDRELLQLASKAPLRSKGKPVEDAGHLPLFVAGNEPRLF